MQDRQCRSGAVLHLFPGCKTFEVGASLGAVLVIQLDDQAPCP